MSLVIKRHPYAKPNSRIVYAALRLIKLKKYLKKISI
jgi:hypothetical protein